MEEPPPKEGGGRFVSIGEDIHEDILSRLSASAFAAAACVSRSWSLVSNRILSRPKLLSAISLNPNLQSAVDEVLAKVLGEPIRPHFAIASVGKKFDLRKTHKLIRSKLGCRIPIIVSEAWGIIGQDAITNEFKEVQWVDDDNDINAYNSLENRYRGIVLTLGFIPGLKVCAIPLRKTIEGTSSCTLPPIDMFITDIKDYTTSVSGCTTPVGVILFADPCADMKPVLEKMDYAMSKDTIIVGDESGRFLCNNGVDSTIFAGRQYIWRQSIEGKGDQVTTSDAIALVFARDRGKPQGEIHFSLVLSTGVSPIGPIYKGASVRVARDEESECSTWLTARRDGSIEKLDGETILQDIENATENDALDIDENDLYIGVTKRRKCSIGSEKGKFVSSLSFHEILGGDEGYLYVKGAGIKTGDTFQFFAPDPQIALMSRNDACENLRGMKQSNGDKKVVCGGLRFSCYGRGESFLGRPNVDSSAFLENFPGVPLSGVFCCGEIGRGCSVQMGQHNAEQRSNNCFLHVYSTVYLLILHTP